MPDARRRLFDSHCHIIDHRFPIVANQGYVQMIYHSMSMEDVERIMRYPNTAVASDGSRIFFCEI